MKTGAAASVGPGAGPGCVVLVLGGVTVLLWLGVGVVAGMIGKGKACGRRNTGQAMVGGAVGGESGWCDV